MQRKESARAQPERPAQPEPRGLIVRSALNRARRAKKDGRVFSRPSSWSLASILEDLGLRVDEERPTVGIEATLQRNVRGGVHERIQSRDLRRILVEQVPDTGRQAVALGLVPRRQCVQPIVRHTEVELGRIEVHVAIAIDVERLAIIRRALDELRTPADVPRPDLITDMADTGPLRIADHVGLVERIGARQTLEDPVDHVDRLGAEIQLTRSDIAIVANHEIDTLRDVGCDVDVTGRDLEILACTRCIVRPGDELAELRVRPLVAAVENCQMAELGDAVVHFDAEVIHRERQVAEVRPEGRLKHAAESQVL